MAFEGLALDDITSDDVMALLQTPEGRTLEFKRALPGGSDAEKKEFLADLSSFANATGGHLVYGVREEAGVGISSLLKDRLARIRPALGIDDVAAQMRPEPFAVPDIVVLQGLNEAHSRIQAKWN